MSNLYLTREAAEAMREKLHDEALTGMLTTDYAVPLSAALEILDSLPVVDAVPAEEALERLRGASHVAVESERDDHDTDHGRVEDDATAVRHALRAATRCPTCGTATVPLDSGSTAIVGMPVGLTLTQADAPPPPDVIRREAIAEAKRVLANEKELVLGSEDGRTPGGFSVPLERALAALDAILKEKE